VLRRGERSIRVTNGVKAEVEAIGELPLELNNGSILHLHNVLYVPSLSRNLIPFHVWMMMNLIASLAINNVLFYLIIKLLVLLSDETGFICYPCLRM
jgi:hypothetical protein